METFKALPREGTARMLDRYTSVYTTRFENVDDEAGVEIQVPYDCKEILIHVEGTQVVSRWLGSEDGSTAFNDTADGYDRVFPVVKQADHTILTYYAPTSEATINISVAAGR